MKKILALVLVFGFSLVHAESVMKAVCHDVNGKQVCKKVKTHKKVEGTKVPDAPPKKKK